MPEEKPAAKHMGTKFLGFVFGLVLAVIYTIKTFFGPLFNPLTDLPMVLYIWAFFLFVIPLLVWLAEIFFRWFHKYSEKFPI